MSSVQLSACGEFGLLRVLGPALTSIKHRCRILEYAEGASADQVMSHI